MALTVFSLSAVSVKPYHLLESRFHVLSFGSLHTPFPFLFSHCRTSNLIFDAELLEMGYFGPDTSSK